ALAGLVTIDWLLNGKEPLSLQVSDPAPQTTHGTPIFEKNNITLEVYNSSTLGPRGLLSNSVAVDSCTISKQIYSPDMIAVILIDQGLDSVMPDNTLIGVELSDKDITENYLYLIYSDIEGTRIKKAQKKNNELLFTPVSQVLQSLGKRSISGKVTVIGRVCWSFQRYTKEK
ncbi:MAG: hypothetical protein KAR06_08200, partial [Deltaproteobacteria bacterium]|nr:hypothetical protein [Deltaproteobacteria bacterium]